MFERKPSHILIVSTLALLTLYLPSSYINAKGRPEAASLLQKGPESTTGAPLKGVDVKLGKNPGGSPAARATTDDKGKFNLGVVPAGSYILTLSLPEDSGLNQGSGTISTKEKGPSAVNVKLARITIEGAPGGRTVRGWDPKNKKAVDLTSTSAGKSTAADKIIIESDGRNPITGICETTIVKSKSNISNN
jgi:hypothetical protein